MQSWPEWRYCRAVKYNKVIDRHLCAMGYVLLLEGLKSEYQIEDKCLVDFHPTGKPYLKEYPFIHFNISHCKEAVVCILSDNEVRVAVETIPAKLATELL